MAYLTTGVVLLLAGSFLVPAVMAVASTQHPFSSIDMSAAAAVWRSFHLAGSVGQLDTMAVSHCLATSIGDD